MKREDFFQLRIDTARRGHSLTILKQHCRLNVRKYFFTHRVVDTWNKMSEDTVNSKTVNRFKKLVQTTRGGAIRKPTKASCSRHSDPRAHRNQLSETSIGSGKNGKKKEHLEETGPPAPVFILMTCEWHCR